MTSAYCCGWVATRVVMLTTQGMLNIINFYLPSAYVKTIQNVSNGLKLALDLIRKYLPESAFTRIYLDEQPVDAGGYVAGAVALESGDINSAGVAMFKIKPQTSNGPGICPAP